jgi:hypothetical protein
MIDEGPVQGVANLGIDRFPEIEAAHLGGGVFSQRRNGE